MSRNAWIIFVVVCVGALAGLVYFSNKNNPTIDVGTVEQGRILPATAESGNIGDHVKGDPESKAVLVEYLDFQCSGCASAYPRIQNILEQYDGKVAFVNRNFPITSAHPHGLAAAATAEAAGLQGKYWEMVELLLNNQQAWSRLSAGERAETFLGYARQLGLDEAKFTADQAGDAVARKIDYDKALARKDNVNSTPSFFLNGQPISSEIWSDDAALKDLIDAALK